MRWSGALCFFLCLGSLCWSEASPRLIFSSVDNWIPYSSSTAPGGGVLPIVARAVFQRMGYSISIDFPPWERALENAEVGTSAGIIGAWYTSSRAKDFLYSGPILQNEIVIFAKTERKIVYDGKLSSLKPYRIGASLGSAFVDTLNTAGLAKNIDPSVDVEMSLTKLIGNRDDVFVDEKLSVLQLLNTKYKDWKDKIEVLSPPIESNSLYVVVSRKITGAQKLIDDFNTGLQQIQSDGTFTQILKQNNIAEK